MKRLTGFLLIVAIAVGCDKTSVTLTAEEQLAYDIQQIDEYLVEKGINAVKLENGIRYLITEMGTGPTPTKDNCFRIKYKGSFLRETTLFDADTTDGFKSPLKQQIVGMQILLKLMPVGSKGMVFIPSSLGYGGPNVARPPGIPANAILKFQEVELMAVYPYNALGNYCHK